MKKINSIIIVCAVLLWAANGVSASTVFSANRTGGLYGFDSDLTGMTELAAGYSGVEKDLAFGNNGIYFSNGQYLFLCNKSGSILASTFASAFNTVDVGPDGFVYTATPYSMGGGLYRFNADLAGGFTQLFVGFGGEDKDLAVSSDYIYFTNEDIVVQCNLSGGMLGYTFDGNFNSVAVGPDGYVYTANSTGVYRFNADLSGFTTLVSGLGGEKKDLAVTKDSIFVANGSSVYKFDLNGSFLAYTSNGGFNTVAVMPELDLILGDADGDGIVSTKDYICVQSHFGETYYPGMPGDANGDGVVDALDFDCVKDNYLGPAEDFSFMVPEPTTALLLLLGGLISLRRRRKLQNQKAKSIGGSAKPAGLTRLGQTRTAVLFVALLIVSSLVSAAGPDLDKGHRILLERGLQINALVFVPETGYFDTARWAESNFTTIDLWNYPIQTTLMPSPSEMPQWSRVLMNRATDILPYEYYYASNLVRLQIGDEQDLNDPTIVASIASDTAALRELFPNVILHTNQWGSYQSASSLRYYMQQVQPDMLMFDTYPFLGNLEGGSPTIFYRDMEKYRKLSLAGNDGTGARPIPFAAYMQTQASQAATNGHVVSESEIRLNNFAAWAFGCKMVSGFVYDNPQHDPNVLPAMFTGNGTASPTPQFNYVAETNRQSRNLGDSLVRLVNTDARMKMGQHKWYTLNLNNTLPSGVSSWDSSADPYMTNITATNLGSTNDGLRGDVVVGYFKPLDAAFTNAGHADDVYFMVVNGLSDETGSAYDCRQLIRLDFDFGSSGIDSLLRLSRDTGEVEAVSLIHDGGSIYHLNLTIDGGTGDLFKYDNGGDFVTSRSPEVHYTFKEAAPGNWEVLVDVTGETAGLSGYDIWVDDVTPGTVSFAENTLGIGAAGFLSENLLQKDEGGNFNFGNRQDADMAIEGIGMVAVDESGVVLDAQALLGILSTETGLGEDNFRVIAAGLLDFAGDDYLDAEGIIPTIEVVPYEGPVYIPGDANHDGVVSAGDYASVQANFGNVGVGILGDANGDGVVSAGDYASVQANFGNTSGSAITPEPATVSLLVLGGTMLFRRKNNTKPLAINRQFKIAGTEPLVSEVNLFMIPARYSD